MKSSGICKPPREYCTAVEYCGDISESSPSLRGTVHDKRYRAGEPAGTVAWLSNSATKLTATELPALVNAFHNALANLSSPADQAEAKPEFAPAVTVRKSLASKDHIISLIDGKKYKMLKRHLGMNGLTPAQYRERYGLKSDYPMVAKSYAETRRNLAKKIGLGRKPAAKVAEAKPAPKAAANSAGPKPVRRKLRLNLDPA